MEKTRILSIAIVTAIVVVVMTLASHFAKAQSFDCRDSKRADEATICRDAELRQLDRRIDRAYARALDDAPRGQSWKIRAEQRTWLARRASCGMNESCLASTMRRRLERLRD